MAFHRCRVVQKKSSDVYSTSSSYISSPRSARMCELLLDIPIWTDALSISRYVKTTKESWRQHSGRSVEVISSYASSKGTSHEFLFIGKELIHLLNKLLFETEQKCPGYGLCEDFSKGEVDDHFSGWFTERGVLGMLEISDYDSIDMISLFLESIVNHCIASFSKFLVTTVLTIYVDLINLFKMINFIDHYKLC